MWLEMVTWQIERIIIVGALALYALWKIPRAWRWVRRNGLITPIKILTVRLYLKLPAGKRELKRANEVIKASVQASVLRHRDPPSLRLPEKGTPAEAILKKLDTWAERDKKFWQSGKISGGVYNGSDKLASLSAKAMKKFMFANPLHPDLFPAVRQMESEIVAMTADLFHGTATTCGTLTTGGTESLIMAMHTYREWGRKERGITNPEIVACETVHVGVDKAAHYLGMTLVHIPVDPLTYKVDMKKLRGEINSNTVCIIGSAPNFANGIIDPIEELAVEARKWDIGLHVDCCLGGYVVPFMEAAGFPLSPFDFRVPGVTSISCDPHKYGNTTKGVSVILYATPEWRYFQYYTCATWTGGLYATPTMTGSKSGAISVAAWTVLNHIGREGYVEYARKIVNATRYIAAEAAKVPHAVVLGQPTVNVVAIASDLNVYAIADAMNKDDGWNLACLQFPSSFHLCITSANCDLAEDFVRDLAKAIEKIKANPDVSKSASAGMYGMAETIPDKGVVGHIGRHFLDCLYMA
mmetsp:Transcript_32831/g.57364  ORF Transcript_32831/g.57364 Transcript_32831/m.57364 type:complete len:524 (+) Transcript_32831:2317-3888(+)